MLFRSAANFDPAFERRIRTHILFEAPGVEERDAIWRVQVHPRKTPLAPDVDFSALARRFELSGGDIKNAVLKAAQSAAAEEGDDRRKSIRQAHLVAGAESVLESRLVMKQSLFAREPAVSPVPSFPAARWIVVAIALLLLAAGGFLGWASSVWFS